MRASQTLTEWERAWCEANHDAHRAACLPTRAAGRRRVAILAARRGDHIVAGAIGNKSAGAIGWSNVFFKLARDLHECGAGSLRMLSEIFPGLPVVGYEGGDSLGGALSSGFEAIGPLRVWIFGSSPSGGIKAPEVTR